MLSGDILSSFGDFIKIRYQFQYEPIRHEKDAHASIEKEVNPVAQIGLIEDRLGWCFFSFLQEIFSLGVS